MVVHKKTLGVLQWYWNGKDYINFDGVKRPKMLPVTLESHGLDPEEWWEIPSNTTLAKRLASHYPFCEAVVEDGELIDVEPWPDWKVYGEQEPETAPAPARVQRRGKYNRRRRAQ